MALAQHYGFKTEMLDITSDLKTALFFACCKYEHGNEWSPLSKNDFQYKKSRTHISANGGDSRYAVLYRSPTEITDLQWCVNSDKDVSGMIIPVGYQPGMRCSYQHAYMMLTQPDYNLQKDRRFDKFRIQLTEELCNWIYNEMQQGALIYPNNEIGETLCEIEKINYQTVFSERVFREVASDFHIHEQDFDAIKGALKKYGFLIDRQVSSIPFEKIAQCNQKYTAQDAMKKVAVLPQISPMITI